ncbi:hypothetical protein ACWCXH_33810 [Kitasatospora sp. NPDC001660]
MTLDLQRAAARRMRRVVVVLVGVVVVLAVTVVALVLNSGSTPSVPVAAPSSSGAPAPTPAPTASLPSTKPLPTEAPGGTFVAPSSWALLPKPTGTRLGMPTGFPHTAEGAAAAAVTATRNSWTWDVTVADRAAEAYSLPDDLQRAKQMVEQSVSASRISVGLPGSGALPPGAHLSVAPIGVQWTPVSADEVSVSVLTRIVYAPGSSTAETTQLWASTNSIVWAGDDWRTKSGPPQHAPEPFDLGSDGFNRAGWKAIQEGDTR